MVSPDALFTLFGTSTHFPTIMMFKTNSLVQIIRIRKFMQGKFYKKKVNYQIRDILRENLEELFFLINKKNAVNTHQTFLR